VDTKKEALVVPITALVDLGGRRGVFQPLPDNTAAFRVVQIGVETGDAAEIINGLEEGDSVITTGAAALRDGDRILLPGGAAGGGRNGGRRGNAGPGGNTTTGNGSAAPAATASAGQRQFAPRGSSGDQTEPPAAAGEGRRGRGEYSRGTGEGGFRRGGGPQAASPSATQ
jgi:hypothetical protein